MTIRSELSTPLLLLQTLEVLTKNSVLAFAIGFYRRFELTMLAEHIMMLNYIPMFVK